MSQNNNFYTDGIASFDWGAVIGQHSYNYQNKIIKLMKSEPEKEIVLESPEGFELVEDLNYIVQKDDQYHLKRWKNTFLVSTTGSTFPGYSVKNCIDGISNKENSLYHVEYKDLIIFRRIPDKPRFKTDKPYPFGY